MDGDGLLDIVLVVEPKQASKAADAEEEGLRTLKIATRSTNGSLKLVKESGKAVYCRTCGGVFGDPFDGLSAGSKTFAIHHYGGSAWRWALTYTFGYSKRDNTWQLVRVDESSFHASEPAKEKRKTYKPPRDFGKIDIADFDPQHFKGVGPK